MRFFLLVIGLILINTAVSQYATGCIYWYNFGLLGAWLLFDYLSHLRGNNTALDLLFNKRTKKFIILFIALAIFGSVIELVGNAGLGLWSYSHLTPFQLYFLVPIFYPFILMSFREMFMLVKSLLKNFTMSVIATIILGIIIWEIPNIYSQDWIYSIPHISFEIFHINIIVIIGWVILISGPHYIYRLLKTGG
ncbi:hypothetical protein GF371_00690 [Candidatus Woesearchaeota archaeon]|nr:hypothetical protein [Candidatus Woesearchaeota archaeon]